MQADEGLINKPDNNKVPFSIAKIDLQNIQGSDF